MMHHQRLSKQGVRPSMHHAHVPTAVGGYAPNAPLPSPPPGIPPSTSSKVHKMMETSSAVALERLRGAALSRLVPHPLRYKVRAHLGPRWMACSYSVGVLKAASFPPQSKRRTKHHLTWVVAHFLAARYEAQGNSKTTVEA